jgi:hypothetical protein
MAKNNDTASEQSPVVNPLNLALWNAVRTPDPTHTKQFSRGGGFSGTSTNSTYLAQLATSVFGPIGIGWGIEIEDEKYVDGAPILSATGTTICREVIHMVRVRLWYKSTTDKQADGKPVVGQVIQYGQTTFVGKNKYGPFTDEEAPKKSLTDAMSKCLSLLGFAADVFLGRFDDNKYVNDAKEAYKDHKAQVAPSASSVAQEVERQMQSRQAGATPATQASQSAQGQAASSEIPAAEKDVLNKKIAGLKNVTDIGMIRTGISMASAILKHPEAIKMFVNACETRIAELSGAAASGIPADEQAKLDKKIASLSTVTDINLIQTGISMAGEVFKHPDAIETFKKACFQRINTLSPVPF